MGTKKYLYRIKIFFCCHLILKKGNTFDKKEKICQMALAKRYRFFELCDSNNAVENVYGIREKGKENGFVSGVWR